MLPEIIELLSAAVTLGVAAAAVVAIERVARRVRVFFTEAYESGRRAGLREAIRVADLRGDLAAELAPKGRLGAGLLRAQVAREVSLELQERLEGER
jgi:hypothetical protein